MVQRFNHTVKGFKYPFETSFPMFQPLNHTVQGFNHMVKGFKHPFETFNRTFQPLNLTLRGFMYGFYV